MADPDRQKSDRLFHLDRHHQIVKRPELTGPLARFAAVLERAAATVRLLDAVTPLNFNHETDRLHQARRAGQRPAPAFVYRPRPDATALVGLLDQVANECEALSPLGLPLAQRAQELALEARLVAAVGSQEFPELAARRYRSAPSDDSTAQRWAHREVPDDPHEVRFRSDDERSAESLVNALRRALGERCLPVRIVARAAMAPLAATGDGVVYVAAGRWISERAAARTAWHEVVGHVLPWLERARSPWPLACLPAGGGDEEEGRALWHEAEAGYLDSTRKKELGLRHLAACRSHEKASIHDIADELEGLGAESHQALLWAARAVRGGGLGRERVYVPAFRRARQTTECSELLDYEIHNIRASLLNKFTRRYVIQLNKKNNGAICVRKRACYDQTLSRYHTHASYCIYRRCHRVSGRLWGRR